MNEYIGNIEKETLENQNFRRVIFTSGKLQLVVMSLKGGEEIGLETHEVDQFIRIEAGSGKVVLNGVEKEVEKDDVIIIPAGTAHNLINGMSSEMKLYSVYAPPEHPDKVVDATKEDAENREGH